MTILNFPESVSTVADGVPIDDLALSVLVEKRLRAAGIATVGELRGADLKVIGLGAKHHGVAIAKELRRYAADSDARQVRLFRAREAFNVLLPAERREIFQELGACGCKQIARTFARSPATAVGAVFGGLIGAFLSSEPKKGDGTC